VSRLSRQCGILNISQPYRTPRPRKGTALLFFFTLYTYRVAQLGQWLYGQGSFSIGIVILSSSLWGWPLTPIQCRGFHNIMHGDNLRRKMLVLGFVLFGLIWAVIQTKFSTVLISRDEIHKWRCKRTHTCFLNFLHCSTKTELQRRSCLAELSYCGQQRVMPRALALHSVYVFHLQDHLLLGFLTESSRHCDHYTKLIS
jgi:hypothetical protein